MDLFPKDIIIYIGLFINDRDFINLTTTCKKIYGKMKYRYFIDAHSLSKIMCVFDKYHFKTIIYDFKVVPPNFDLNILSNIETIIFSKNYSGLGDFSKIYELANLKFIDAGFHFNDINAIKNVPEKIINKQEFVLKTIANYIALNYYSEDLDLFNGSPCDISENGSQVYANVSVSVSLISDQFPKYFNYISILKIHLKCIDKILKNNAEDISSMFFLINFYRKKYDGIHSIDIFKKYIDILNINVDSPSTQIQIDKLQQFRDNNFDSFVEFLNYTKLIIDHIYLYVVDIKNHICQYFGCDSINDYLKLWEETKYGELLFDVKKIKIIGDYPITNRVPKNHTIKYLNIRFREKLLVIRDWNSKKRLASLRFNTIDHDNQSYTLKNFSHGRPGVIIPFDTINVVKNIDSWDIFIVDNGLHKIALIPL